MYNFPWGIESTFAFSLGDVEHIFKYFPQHFRVNSYFLIHRFIFFDGKVVTVKYIQNTSSNIARFVFLFIAEKRFRNGNIGISPVVIGFKQTTIQKRDSTIKTLVIGVYIVTFFGKGFIKQVLQFVFEEVHAFGLCLFV